MRHFIRVFCTYAQLTLLFTLIAGRVMAQTDFWEQTNFPNLGTRNEALAINSGGDIFVGTNSLGVYRSSDNGDNWSRLNTLPHTDVRAFAINSNDDIFAGTWGGGVFRSTDNGDTWSQGSLTSNRVQAFAINSSGDIFAGAVAGQGAIFRSTDNGDNWSQLNTGLTNTHVQALAINSSGDIFAGGRGGVSRSSDNGDTWSQINTGLPDSSSFEDVFTLAINSSGDIFAGTQSRVFRHIESPTSVGEISTKIPSSFVLEQNYPNPFNPVTLINYQLSMDRQIELTIYNQLGQEVRTLVNERKPAGVYQILWDGRDHSGKQVVSGVYLYRFQAGSFIETRKMVLLR